MTTPALEVKDKDHEPSIKRSITLQFVGDWGQANFHRICSWLAQEFCDRAGPRSRVAIWNLRSGGLEEIESLYNGEVQLCIGTPAKLLSSALNGTGIFTRTGPLESLRALAVLPQRDRMMLAVHPKYNIHSFEDLRRVKPPLRIATSVDDGTNFIGYVARRMMEAHGIDRTTLESWGGSYVLTTRPEQAIANARNGLADAILQEAIMTPWWAELIKDQKLVPIPVEKTALLKLASEPGFEPASIRAGFWNVHDQEIPTIDFSDFLILVRDDLPDDIAYLLTWCLVETRNKLEVQYTHIPQERSPLTYPLDPVEMAKTSIPLHQAARRFYKESGYIP